MRVSSLLVGVGVVFLAGRGRSLAPGALVRPSLAPRPVLLPVHRLTTPTTPTRRGAAGRGDLRMSSVAAAVPTTTDRSISPGPHVKVAGRAVNAVGAFFLLSVFSWAFVFFPALLLAAAYSKLFDPKKRRLVDWAIFWWAKCAMLTCTFKPRLTGLENLPPVDEAVMIIPNHTSFLDILSLSGFLPRPLKYVSKHEILRIPLIGWAMRLAGHIAIRRSDRQSQLATIKDTVDSLKAGNTVVTFAEGTRSKDGRLRAFKKGPFKMSSTAGVNIVPVSICDLHRWMPSSAMLPLGFPRRTEIKIHPVVTVEGKSDMELQKEVFEAINSGLPEFQKSNLARN